VTKVLLDAFPCEVLTPGGQLVRRARAWVTDEGVVVATEPTRGEVVLSFAARHSAPPELDDTRKPKRHQRHLVRTDEGEVVVSPTLGCLCGFPSLRAMSLDDVRREVAV
jgi:hypothetical protein